MDSITHALYRLITAEHATQIDIEKAERTGQAKRPSTAGLLHLALKRGVHEAYADAAGTDLHISAVHSFNELLALQMEFIAAGFAPPASMTEGAEIIIGSGRIDVYVPSDNAAGEWTAILGPTKSGPGGRRAGWEEA